MINFVFDGMGSLNHGKSLNDFMDAINNSENGVSIKWRDLYLLANDMSQIIDIVIIGNSNLNLMKRYENYQTMYESCDIVIEMVDSSFWQVCSKDDILINKIGGKFKKIKFVQDQIRLN